MGHQHRSLFLDMPIRLIINKVKTLKSDLKKQLLRLNDMDINNYFILGK